MKQVLFAPDVEEDLFQLIRIDVPKHFYRYGSDAKYISYNRSNHTTWYIIFEERQEAYLVTQITNNHVSGQYFNQ